MGVQNIVEKENIVYVYRKHFRSIYTYSNGNDKICRESLRTVYKNINNNAFLIIKKYIINLECISKVRKKEITLSNGITLKLNKKDMDTVKHAIHNYYHHIKK